jgi:kumamolisin
MAIKMKTLRGSVPANTHALVGQVDPQESIDITIRLRRKSEDGLPTLAEFVAGKRAFMSRHDLEERHGASAADARAVERWARANKLSVSNKNLGRRHVTLTGSAEAMNKAFGVTLSHYKHKRTDTTFRSPNRDVSIPAALAPIVSGVFGLSDMPVAVRRRKVAMARAAAIGDLKAQFPGSFYPTEVARLYNFPAKMTGKGEKVAVLEFGGGFDPKVLASYFKNTLGLSSAPTVNALSVLGAKNHPGKDGTTGEVYLDIEVIGGMAPAATIDVYFAPWTGNGYLTAIEEAIHNDDYAAVSISYGLDEDMQGGTKNQGWPMLNHNIEEAFRDAAAVGIPVFVSTGDQGSSSQRGAVLVLGHPVEVTVYSPTAHASYPASSPYATAVGGTQLYEKDGKIDKEVVWNELGPLQNGFYWGGATGGGVSDRYPQVPSYQTDAGIKPVSANGGTTGRGIPDVSGNAGASTGYLVSQPPGSQDPIAPVGGTSASAPMWAALMACVRQALAGPFRGSVPPYFFNDFVYAKGKTAAFHDIVSGRHMAFDAHLSMQPGSFVAKGTNQSAAATGYEAKKGYDLCTGWGSPNGAELLTELTAWLKAQPKPTP